MTPLRFLPAASGVVLAAMLIVVPAGPAQAATANITISGPAAGAHLTSTSVAITGSANIDPGLLGNNAVTDLNVAVTFEGAAFDSCDNAGCGAGAGHSSTTFSFTPKALARNGPYGVTANVAANEYLLGTSLGPTVRTASASTNFNVGIPPAAPRNVKAQVNADNSVTVSWTANAEPDLIGYQIQRQDSASSAPHVVNSFLSPTSWTDTTTAATGGDFGYTVIAFRPGADGTATANTVMHTSSAVASAKVAAPIPTTTVAPVAGSQNPTTTTTVAVPSVSAAAPDLSAFLAQATKAGAIPASPPASPAPSTSSAPQVVVPAGASSELLPALSPPDTYAPTLPYPAPATATASTSPPANAGGPRVALPGRQAASHQHRSLLFSIAGGLLLCVVGLVVRVANHRREHLPLEPVMGEDLDGLPVEVPPRRAERSTRTTARTEALAAVVGRGNDRAFLDAAASEAVPVRLVPAADADRVRVGPTVDDESAHGAVRPDWRTVGEPAPAAAAGLAAPPPEPAGAEAAPAEAKAEAVLVQAAGAQGASAEATPAEAAPAGASQPRTRRAGTARPWRSGPASAPAVGQPGDYFRFILGDGPPSDAEHVEVTAPAG